MEGKVEVSVDKEIVRPIVEAEIHSVLANALGDKAELLQAAVGRALMLEVSPSTGKKPEYSSDKRVPYIEYLAAEAIRECAKAAVETWVESNRAKITEEVERQLQRKTKGLAKIMVDGFAKALKEDYRLKIAFDMEPTNWR